MSGRRPYRLVTVLVGVVALLGAGPLLPLAMPGAPPAAAAPVGAPLNEGLEPSFGPAILEIDSRHVVLEWAAPPYELARGAPQGQPFDRAAIPGCPAAGGPGEPELPVCTALLGVPPDAALALRVLEAETTTVPGTWRIAPVPEQVVERGLPPETERPPEIGVRRVQGPVYAAGGIFPAAPAALGEPAFLRHQRLVAVHFYPLQYAPAGGELLYHPRLRLEVTFAVGAEPMGYVAEPADFEQLLARALLNDEQAREWRRTAAQPLDRPPVPPDPGWRIPVRQEGLYRLTYEWLQSNGFPVGEIGDAHTIRLLRYGQEVAVRVAGEEDGSFDPGDSILFYGRPLQGNRFSDTEYYWLTYNGALGRRMGRRNGIPQGIDPVPPSFSTTEHLERNLLYYPDIPWRPDHDHWFWNYTFPEAGRSAATYTFPGHPLAAESYTAALQLHLNGYSTDSVVDPDHHIRIFFNNVLLQDLYFDGRVELTPTLYVDASLLQPGGNVVRIESPGDTGAFADIVFYDWLELGQRRLFTAEGDQLRWQGAAGSWEYHLAGYSEPTIILLDVTDPDNPGEIVSPTIALVPPTYALSFSDSVTRTTTYLAVATGRVLAPTTITAASPENLLDPSLGADYVVITHHDFYAQAQALAAFRANQGLRTMVVDVEDVYDLFAYGRRVPESLHDFLAYAYANWTPPAPAYIVLLGDGHLDFKNYLGYGVGNFILPYMVFVDPWMGETVADNRYVCLSGADTLPDMHLGRLPANTPAEAQTMVNKIIAYESAPPPGAWRQQALFIADDADQAGNFPVLSDALIAGYYPAPYQSERVYLGITHPYENPSVAARNAIIAAINEGRLLVNYIGHGSLGLWAGERLLDRPDLSDLQNSPLLPVALPMTCDEGLFAYPQSDPYYHALAEVYLRSEGKGWIASWSPTGRGVTSGHDYLDRGFFQAVFLDDEWRLGPATLAGKLRLWASGSSRDLLDTYLLFGDPALEMPLLKTDVSLDKAVEPAGPLRPGDPLTFTISLANAGPASAHHVVLSDTLSPYIVSPTVQAAGLALTPRPGTRYVWDVADLAAGQSGAVTITAHLSWQTPAGTYLNEALLTTTAHETSTQNNADMVSFQVVAGPPYAVAVSAEPPAIPADGASQSLIRAHVADTAGNPVADGTAIAFRADAGTFPDGGTYYATTTAQGNASVLLRSTLQVVTATVTVTSGQAMGSVQVPFASMEPHTVLLVAYPTAIPLTGTAALTATVYDVLGHPVRDGTGVTFTTSLGQVSPAVGQTHGGVVTSTLYGEGLAGRAAILAHSGAAAGTAAVRIGSGSSYTLTLEVVPPALPADGQSAAAVTATLVRADGQPLTGTHWVYFTTTLGTISPTAGQIVSGTHSVAVTLTAGTRAGTAWLVASSEQASDWATVAFLPGAPAALILTVNPASIPVGGSSALAAATVRDAYGNAVADGTPVTFATDLGSITPTIAATQNGRAQAVLLSGTEAGTATVAAQSGTASGGAAVRFTPLAPYTLTLTATPTVVVADGQSAARLSAWVGDRFANPVADGTAVTFYTSLGTVRPAQAFTLQGWATAALTSTAVGTATVQAFAGQSGNAAGEAAVRFIPGPPATILLTASPARLYADGVSTSTVTAYLWDSLGHTVADGTPVTLSASLGTISPELAWTENGRVRGVLRSAPAPGWALVGAASGPAWGQVGVEFFQYRLYLPLIVR